MSRHPTRRKFLHTTGVAGAALGLGELTPFSVIGPVTAEAAAVWDAAHLHAAELMIRQPDVGYPLHGNTATNALHHAFTLCADPVGRLRILLQAVAWQCHTRRRKLADAQWKGRDARIDLLTGGEVPEDAGKATEAILALLPGDRDEAARKAFSLARRHPESEVFQQAACRLVVTKVRKKDVVDIGIHDIKFAEAIFEDYGRVSSSWQPHMLAASVYWLPGSNSPASQVMERTGSGPLALKRQQTNTVRSSTVQDSFCKSSHCLKQ